MAMLRETRIGKQIDRQGVLSTPPAREIENNRQNRQNTVWTPTPGDNRHHHHRSSEGMRSSNNANSFVVDNDFTDELNAFMSQMRHANHRGEVSATPDTDQPPRQTEGDNEENDRLNYDRNNYVKNLPYRHNNINRKNRKLMHKEVFSKKIHCILQNCHKSCAVNTEITQFIRHKGNSEYVAFFTEPGLAAHFGVGPRTPRALPYTNNTFYHSKNNEDIRSCIIADVSQDIDLMP